MRRVSRTDKPDAEMFVNKVAEGCKFGLGERVHGTYRRGSALFDVDLEVVRSVWCQRIGFRLAKNVSKIMILFRNVREVGSLVGDGGGFAGDGGIGEVNLEALRARLFRS